MAVKVSVYGEANMRQIAAARRELDLLAATYTAEPVIQAHPDAEGRAR